MFAYYRSSCYSTQIQRILRGSITNADSLDVVLVKSNSLEWLSVNHVTDQYSALLVHELEQSTFGTILDAQLLPCSFIEDDDTEEEWMNEDYRDIPYSKYIRNHSKITGDDMIVAISEYGKLVFMTIVYHELFHVKRFETVAEVHLDSPGLEFTKRGRKLATDPYGRAIAVGSFQDDFDILIINKNISRTRFDPIVGRGVEKEEGIIWHMEFLHTQNTTMDRILLVLVVYNDVERLCRLILYAINASDINNITIEKISRLPLEKNTPLPLLIIPLKFEYESFLLVTEQQVSLLSSDDLACGNVLYPSSLIPRQFGSTECPLFTAYTWHLDPKERIVYIASDQGEFFKLEIKPSGEIDWVSIQQTLPVSQSMCMIGSVDIIDEGPHDIILHAGESSNSQVIAIPAKQPAIWCRMQLKYTVLQEFLNRSPLSDYQVIENFINNQDALVTCSGQDEQGSLSIITHGVGATLLQSSKADWIGVSKLWNVTASHLEHASCLIASSMLDTRLLYARDGHIKDATSTSNIEFDKETIHASAFSIKHSNLILQVCHHTLFIIDIDAQGNACVASQWSPCSEPDQQIELATSFNFGNCYYIALCIVNQTVCTLQIVKIFDRNENDINSPLSLSFENIASSPLNACPSYIGYFNFSSNTALVLGTFDSTLLFFSVDNEALHLIQSANLSCLSSGSFSVPHSMALLESNNDQYEYLIIGLRQGSFLIYKLNDLIGPAGKRPQLFNVGTLPVRLFKSHRSSNTIYVLSEKLWKLTCADTGAIELDHILLPQFEGHIDAFVPSTCGLSHIAGEPVVIIADNKLLVYQLDSQSQKNTQQISLGETPRKVIYDKKLNYIVAVTTRMVHDELKYFIRLIDIHSGMSITNSQPLLLENDIARKDMVLSAAEWSVTNNKKTYTYLCIGVGHTRETFQALKPSSKVIDRGTLLLYRLKSNRSSFKNGMSLKCVWTQEKLPGGVFAICPHPAGLLFSAGRHLYLYRLDPVKGKLVEIAHKSLHFNISSIRGDENRICITSRTDSIAFYQLNTESNTIEFLKCDATPRDIHQSLMVTSRFAVGVGPSGSVVGLLDDPEDQTYERRLECKFAFHYSDIITRPSFALLRSHRDLTMESDILSGHVLSWDNETLVKPIVGCTVSGGIIHVYRIDERLYRVLCVLQELMLEFGPTKPLLGSPQNFKSWYCKLSGDEKNTIHGDLVESFLRLSLDEQERIVLDQQGCTKRALKDALETCFDTGGSENDVRTLNHLLLSFEKYR